MVTALLLKSSLSFSLIGAWSFYEIIYRGERQPRPNADLILCSEYLEDGSSHLLWYRENQPGFCERWGNYEYDGKILTEEVLRVNPENAAECSADPDMQLGQKQTKAELIGEELHLHLALADEPLIYIWKKVRACPSL